VEIFRLFECLFSIRRFVFSVIEEFSEIFFAALNLGDFHLSEAVHRPTGLPDAVLSACFVLLVNAESIRFAILPVASIHSSIGQLAYAVAMLDMIFVFAYVLLAISPSVEAYSMHLALKPLALVFPAVWPAISAKATKFIFGPLSSVFSAIQPLILPFAVLA